MTNANAIPATTNPNGGFHAAMGAHAEAAWPLAISAYSQAIGVDAEAIQHFLDSEYGRNLANLVCANLEEGHALEQAIAMAASV